MKNFIILFFLTYPFISFTQTRFNEKDLFSIDEITWCGMDFKKAKFIGYFKIDKKEIKDKYIDKWNYFIVSKEQNHKFDFESLLKKNKVPFDYSCINVNNKNLDAEKLFVLNKSNSFITEDTLRDIVKNYRCDTKEGIGLVFIVDYFDKIDEQLSGWLMYFDLSTKDIILKRYYTEKAHGYNPTWLWTKPLKKMLKKEQIYFQYSGIIPNYFQNKSRLGFKLSYGLLMNDRNTKGPLFNSNIEIKPKNTITNEVDFQLNINLKRHIIFGLNFNFFHNNLKVTYNDNFSNNYPFTFGEICPSIDLINAAYNRINYFLGFSGGFVYNISNKSSMHPISATSIYYVSNENGATYTIYTGVIFNLKKHRLSLGVGYKYLNFSINCKNDYLQSNTVYTKLYTDKYVLNNYFIKVGFFF